MKLSIIIVNYNTEKKIISCLESIYNNPKFGEMGYEVIVVDNNSSNRKIDEVKLEFPRISLIKSRKNLGMGGGNNLGIRKAIGDFLLIINPDIIIKEDAIEKLLEYVEKREEIGVISPKLVNSDLTIQHSCRRYPKSFTPIIRRTFLKHIFKKHINNYLMKDFNHDSINEVDWIFGACLLVRRELLNKIGNFDDKNYFMYFEDIDLCKRTWNSGYKVIYYPYSVVIHDHARESLGKFWIVSIFTNRLTREHIKSWIKYLWKWNVKSINNSED